MQIISQMDQDAEAWETLRFDIEYGYADFERECEEYEIMKKIDNDIKKELRSKPNVLEEVDIKLLRAKRLLRRFNK